MFNALAWGKARAARPRSENGRKSAGQSLVEFTLILPLLLSIVLVGLDFGRSYTAWVGLNNAARIAANYASLHADAWGTPGNATYRAEYASLVTNDFRNAGCTAPSPIPDPIFIDGSTLVGARVKVDLTCSMPLVTPLIGSVFPSAGVTITGTSIFVIRNGTIAGPSSGGGGGAPIPTFTADPVDGDAPLTVTLTNTTANPGTVLNWYWDFGDTTVSTLKDPGTHTYTIPGSYTITLRASNTSGTNITNPGTTITVHPPAGLTATFTWDPPNPTRGDPLTFTGVVSGGLPGYTWNWVFGDGYTSNVQNPTHTYSTSGTFHVTLTVVDSLLAVGFHEEYLVVTSPLCNVPDLGGPATQAQKKWNDAGFLTSVTFDPGVPPEWQVSYQSQGIGASLPCDTTSITVKP